jgi:hypothetical protein
MASIEPEDDPRRLTAVVVALLILMAASVFGVTRLQRSYLTGRATAEIASWPEFSAAVARITMAKYGPPDTLGSGQMAWYGRAPWKRIIVNEDLRRGPLEQTISFSLNADTAKELRDFGRGVTGDVDDSELSARSDSEALNILALNLADDIATGGKNPASARAFYDRARELAVSGKSTGYTAKLLFDTNPMPRAKSVPY